MYILQLVEGWYYVHVEGREDSNKVNDIHSPFFNIIFTPLSGLPLHCTAQKELISYLLSAWVWPTLTSRGHFSLHHEVHWMVIKTI